MYCIKLWYYLIFIMSGPYASFADNASGNYDVSMRSSRAEKLGRKYQWNKGKKPRNE